jgi:AraC-like DNA-binding protein
MHREITMPFEAWECTLRDTCGHYYGLPSKAQRVVDGYFKKNRICGLDVADFSCNIDKIERTPDGIRRDDQEHLFLLMQISGRSILQRADQQTSLLPGDLCLLDSTTPVTLNFGGNYIQYLSLHLPRASLLLEADRNLLVGERLSADNEACARLRRYISDWIRQGKKPAASAPDYLLDLTRLTFTPNGIANTAAIMSSDLSRYELAIRDIDIHLNRPELSLEWLARRIGISPRQLERDFLANNSCFVELLRERRLKLVVETMEIRCRLGKDIRITEVAFDCGFRDISNFNRAFRAYFNDTPRHFLAKIRDGQRSLA